MTPTPASPPPPFLSADQWQVLLFQTPESVKRLVMKLAVYHGAVERPAPAECPPCGRAESEQFTLRAE